MATSKKPVVGSEKPMPAGTPGYIFDSPRGPNLRPEYTRSYGGPMESPYDRNTPEDSKLIGYRHSGQSTADALGNMLLQTAATVGGQTLDAIGSILDIPASLFESGPNDYTNPISQWGRDLQDFTRAAAPIWVDPDKGKFGQGAWWLANAPNLASTLSMLVPQLGAAKLVGGVARWMRLSQNAKQLAQIGVGALAGRHAENYMEAGQVYKNVYEDAVANGIDEKEAAENASKAAALDYSMNYANLAFDVVQLGAILKPFKNASGITGRFSAVGQLGGAAAERRALDMTGKSLMDGAKWYERAAMTSYKFSRPVAAQLTEGVEEGWNTISAKEGERLGRVLNGTASQEDLESNFTDRFSKYVVDPEVGESAFWGVLGGMAYQYVGGKVNKAMDVLKGREGAKYGSVKAADIGQRQALIKEYLSVMNDPTVSPLEKFKTKHKSLFSLVTSAMNAENLDLLKSDLQDAQYQEVLAKAAGTEANSIKGEIDKLVTDIDYIANAYNNYAGQSEQAWKRFNQAVDVSAFGDDSRSELVKRGFFEFVEPQVADRMAMLDYYSYKANESTLEARKQIVEELAKINPGNNPHFEPVIDNMFKMKVIDAQLENAKQELKDAADAKMSDRGTSVIKDYIKLLESEKQGLQKQKENLKFTVDTAFEQGLVTSDFDNMYQEYEVLATLNQSLKREGFRIPLAAAYESIIDDQKMKYQFAKERQMLITDPEGYYAEVIEDDTKLKDMRKTRDEEKKRYGFLATDSAQIKALKRRLVDTFDPEIKEGDSRYNLQDKTFYNDAYKKAYEEVVANSDLDTLEDIDKAIAETQQLMDEGLDFGAIQYADSVDNIDFNQYSLVKAKLEALKKVKSEKQAAQNVAATSTPTVAGTTPVTASDPLANVQSDFEAGARYLADMLDTLQMINGEYVDFGALLELNTLQYYLTNKDTELSESEREELLEQLITNLNNEFPTIYNNIVHPDAVRLFRETFEQDFESDAVPIITDPTKFKEAFQARVDEFKSNIKNASKIKPVVSPTVVSQVNDGDIVFDEMPEPENPVDHANAMRTEHQQAMDVERTASLSHTGDNEGFVTLYISPSILEKDSFDQDGVPKVREDISGSTMDLFDPQNPLRLSAGDRLVFKMRDKMPNSPIESVEVYREVNGQSDFIGYLSNSAKLTNEYGKKAQEAEAKVRQLLKDNNKVIHATLGPRSITFGNSVHSKSLTSNKEHFQLLPLSKMAPISSFNDPNNPSSVFLAVNNGSSYTIRNSTNALVSVQSVMPNDSVIVNDADSRHAGQLVAIIPTNMVFGKTKDANKSNKHGYVARVLRTTTLASAGKDRNNDTMGTALLKKLVDPYNNQAFIKSLKPLLPGWNIDVNMPLEKQYKAMFEFYKVENITRIVNQLMFTKGRRDDTKVTGSDYKYPFYIGVAASTKKHTVNNETIPNLSIQISYGEGDKNRHYFELGAVDFTNDTVKSVFASIENATSKKPFRVHASEIGKQYGSGSYYGFAFNENNDLILQEYPNGYLEYLENKVLSTVAGVSVPKRDGTTRQTFFDVPRVKLDMNAFEEYKPAANKGQEPIVNHAPVSIAVGFQPENVEVESNKAEDVRNMLNSTKELQLTPDQTEYLGPNGVYKRTTNVLFTPAESSDLLEKSTEFGTSLDQIVRDFFTAGENMQTNITEGKYPGIPGDKFTALLTRLENLKKYFEANGETVYVDRRVVYDDVKKVAGELDIMTVDKSNNVRIYDTKSMLDPVEDVVSGKAGALKIEKWTKQQNAYRIMMKNQFNVNVAGIFILPIQISYGSENTDVVNLNPYESLIQLPFQDSIKGRTTNFEIYKKVESTAPVSTTEGDAKSPITVMKLGNFQVEKMEDGKLKLSTLDGRVIGTYPDMAQVRKAMSDSFLTGLNNNDESANVVGLLSDVMNTDSIQAVLQDPTANAYVRGNLIELFNTAIMDVLYEQHLALGKKKLNVEKELRPRVLDNLKKRLKFLEDQQQSWIDQQIKYLEKGARPEVIAFTDKKINEYTQYVSYHNEAIKKFDKDFFTPEVADKVGDFIGYFRTSYFFVSGSKLIKNVGLESEEGEVDISSDNVGLSQRYKDDWYTSINPKDTISFQTKVFLSRIPKRDPQTYTPLMNAAGGTAYYSLDDVLNTLYNYLPYIDSSNYAGDLERLADATNDSVLNDLVDAINTLDGYVNESQFQWQFTKSQLINKMASALLLQSRKAKTVISDITYDDNQQPIRSRIRVIDNNRQNLEEQLINIWQSNFKENLSQFYNVEVVTENGIPVPKIKSLVTRKYNTYSKPTGKVITPTIPNFEELEIDGRTNRYHTTRFLIYDQLRQFAEIAKSSSEVYSLVLPDAFDVTNPAGEVITSITKDEMQEMLNYVEWPTNVQFSKADIKHLHNSTLSSVYGAINDLMDRMIDTNTYSPETYLILADLMARVGVTLSSNRGDVRHVMNIQKPYGRGKLSLHSIDPKARTVQSFVMDHFGGFVKKLMDFTVANPSEPFNDLRLNLRNVAKVAKLGWPGLKTPNITTIKGENEFTNTPHHYLSNRIQQIKNDPELRRQYLNNPFSSQSQILKDIFNDEKQLASFDIHDFRGVNFNNYVSSNKEMNEFKQLLTDYGIFQNQESSDSQQRGIGYYITMHGESKTAPMISMMKRTIDFDFVLENGNIRIALKKSKNSPFYNDLSSQFKSELNRVVHTENAFQDIKKVEQEKGFEAAVEYAHNTYKMDFHYKIVNNELVRGDGNKLYLLGPDVFADTKRLIYTSSGQLKPDLMAAFTGDQAARSKGETMVDQVFNEYVDDFLNNVLNKHMDSLNAYSDLLFKTAPVALSKDDTPVAATSFPLFDAAYIRKMNKTFISGDSNVNVLEYGENGALTTLPVTDSKYKNEIIDDSFLDGINPNDPGYAGAKAMMDEMNEAAENSIFPELHKRYVVADFLFNHLLFKNTYLQITEDPADFLRADNYPDLIEEMNKRLKHHLGAGNLKPGLKENNIMPVIWFNDVTPASFIKRVSATELSTMPAFVQQSVQFMMGDSVLKRYVSEEKGIYSLPSNYEELAAVYQVNKRDAKATRNIMKAMLTQKTTDAGSVMTLREAISRMVRNGDIDQKRAPELYRDLSNPDLNTESFNKIGEKYGYDLKSLLVNKYIYSGNTMTEYNGQTLNDFTVKKDSELILIPALVKNTQWGKIYEDLEAAEKQFLNSRKINPTSPEGFSSGIVLSPITARKSKGIAPIDLFDNDGLYNGSISTATRRQELDRTQSREQQKKEIKDLNEITAASQLLPFSQIDVTSDIDFSRVLNHSVELVKEFTNVQLNNARYGIQEQIIARSMNKLMNGKGVLKVGNDYSVENLRTLVGSMKNEIVNQNGVGIVLEAFNFDETGRLPLPLSMTAFGAVTQSVFLKNFNKAINARKMPGMALIQATAVGYNKDKVTVDPTLKGMTISLKTLPEEYETRAMVENRFTEAELADIIQVTNADGKTRYKAVVNQVEPVEIAVGWNFRDSDGNELKYEDYVDPVTQKPLPNIDPEILKVITYRVPNTPHNTVGYSKIVKFLPPTHKDVVLVSPQFMTMMSSDLDVDTLYIYRFNYNVEDGKMRKIHSVVHTSQKDYASVLNTDANRIAVRNRLLSENNGEYVSLLKELRQKQAAYFNYRKQLSEVLDANQLPIAVVLQDDTARKNYVELVAKIEALESQMQDPAIEMKELYEAVKQGDVSAKDAFSDKYMEILAEVQNGELDEDQIDEEVSARVVSYVKNIVTSLKRKGFKEDPMVKAILDITKTDLQKYQQQALQQRELFGENEISKLKEKIAQIETAFDESFDFNKLNEYEKQTMPQLQNALIETLLIQYSNPNIFKKSSTPLSTDILKEKVSGNVLQWMDSEGKLVEKSIEEMIYNRGFASINDYQSQADFKNNSNNNSDLIGVFATALRQVQLAQNLGLFVAPDADMETPMRYAEVELNKDKKKVTKTLLSEGKLYPAIKRDGLLDKNYSLVGPADNSIYRKDGIKYYHKDNAYSNGIPKVRKPDQSTRFRLDSIYHYDNNGNKVYVSTMIMASLQAALDGIKDPIAPKLKLNMNNVSAYVGHLLMGYSDEVVLLLQQPIITKFIRDVKEEKLRPEFKGSARQMMFIESYITANKLFSGEVLEKAGEQAKQNPIAFLEILIGSEIISEADMNDMLVGYYEMNGKPRQSVTTDVMFHKKQLALLLNFLKAERIGNQMTTAQQNMAIYSKGLPNGILEANEKYEGFLDLHRYHPGNKMTSSVPNLGNIHLASKLLQKGSVYDKIGTKKTFYDIPIIHGLKPVMDVIKSTGTELFTELSPLMTKTYDLYQVYADNNSRVPASRRKKLAVQMTAFLWSNPELYMDLFESQEEYDFFIQYGRQTMMAFGEYADNLEKIENKEVFVFSSSLAQAAKDLAQKTFPTGETYGSVYKLLNAFKHITGNSRLGEADYVLYMNIADMKETFENEMAMSIPMMLDSKDAQVRALAKQLVLYAHLNGGISSPNSFVKHIPQSVRNRFNINQRMRDLLDTFNKNTRDADKLRRDIADSFLIQYFQHNPSEVPALNKRQHLRPNENEDNMYVWYHPEHGYVGYMSEDYVDFYGKKRLIVRDNNTGNLFTLGKVDGFPSLVQVDRAGKSRWNSTEYSFDTSLKAVRSIVYENMAGGRRKEIYQNRREQSENEEDSMSLRDVYELSLGEGTDTQSMLSNIAEYSKNQAFRNLSQYLGSTENNVPIDVKPTMYRNNMVLGGVYDSVADQISISKDWFFEPDNARIEAFEETLLHETIHGMVDRTITSVLNPNRLYKHGDNFKRYITEAQLGSLKPVVRNLGGILEILNTIATNNTMPGYEAVESAIARYDEAVKTVDTYYTTQHAYVNLFKLLKDYNDSGLSFKNVNPENEVQVQKLGKLMKEFTAYFMTSPSFQRLLNDIDISTIRKESSKKTMLQEVIDFILDILDELTGGQLRNAKRINSSGILDIELKEKSLAHISISNMLNLIDFSIPSYQDFSGQSNSERLKDLLGDSSENVVGIVNFDFTDQEVQELDIISKCKS